MKHQFIHQCRKLGTAAARSTLDALMPPSCPVTNEEIGTFGTLSPKAWNAVHFIAAPFCPRCGVPFAAEYGEEVECPSCIASPPDFERARAAVVYDDATHKLIVGFKHSDRTELAPMFANWMVVASQNLVSEASILMPIPLHPSRRFARRYNQSALLAQGIAKKTGAQLALNDLVRRRATPPQKDLSADARRRNVSGAFGFRDLAAQNRYRGAHVVLVDDVLTTGATLSAAARALKRGGAARVDALVLARVVKGGIGAI
ncbi:ComF family protein [Hyphococcus lacteus]|uniref:ComF family protein n=1 Tax=Hyphococcus lacteus TaxID=3143536 RepID=A0ABV3Z3F3_9PROT